MHNWTARWRRFWTRPNTAMLAAGAEGERRVASVRLVVVALLLITPTYRLIAAPQDPVFFWGFVMVAVGMLFALTVFFYLRWRMYEPWLGFTTACLDGTLVSVALFLFTTLGSPLAGVQDRVSFEVYFLVLMAASLRQDRRICVVAGSLIVLQYTALFLYAQHAYNLDAAYEKMQSMGMYSPSVQWTRVILLAAAAYISVAYVERSRGLVTRAMHDPMTGLLNRSFFDSLFGIEIERARRYKNVFAVVVADADHFKRINDTHGHLAGDEVLRHLAAMFTEMLRESDVIVRYGGEEFVILLRETGREAAREKMESLRAAIEQRPIVLADNVGDIRVTISAGIAVYPEDGQDAQALLSHADKRLFRAKQQGRNRVIAGESTAAA